MVVDDDAVTNTFPPVPMIRLTFRYRMIWSFLSESSVLFFGWSCGCCSKANCPTTMVDVKTDCVVLSCVVDVDTIATMDGMVRPLCGIESMVGIRLSFK